MGGHQRHRLTSTCGACDRHGVTLRHVLMGLGSDQLYSLDKRLADPRAPVNKKPTQEEMGEGILPYHVR
jgi:hypothetical protein|eukprot:COSAG01_NODE_509_length_16084_cov_18.063180_8_plen_69_part_00